MRKLGNFMVVILLMLAVSCISLAVISILANIQDWQADKALLGIILTYGLAGFVGGFSQKIRSREKKGIGKRMAEGVEIASAFMFVLVLACMFVIDTPFTISSRLLRIWALLIGSACLGRIL